MSRGQYTHRSFRRWKTVGCVYSWELKMLGFENKKSALVSITNPNTQPKTTLQAATNGLPLSHHCSSYRQTKAPLHFRHWKKTDIHWSSCFQGYDITSCGADMRKGIRKLMLGVWYMAYVTCYFYVATLYQNDYLLSIADFHRYKNLTFLACTFLVIILSNKKWYQASFFFSFFIQAKYACFNQCQFIS